MKYLILCGLLLLSIVPLSCSQKECEYRAIAKFANYEVEYFEGLPFTVVSGNNTLTEPFSVHERKLQIFCASSYFDVEPGSGNMSAVKFAGTLITDLYHYPDMRFVKRAVDATVTYDVRKDICFANVEKGMYCLWVSSSHVSWGATVSEYL